MATNPLVTLCGSTRFETNFIVANRELGRRGIPCFGLSCLPRDREDTDSKASGAEKTMFDLVHLNKILASTHVLIVGDGYAGPSTSREIVWAALHKKIIMWEHHYLLEQDPSPDSAVVAAAINWPRLAKSINQHDVRAITAANFAERVLAEHPAL